MLTTAYQRDYNILVQHPAGTYQPSQVISERYQVLSFLGGGETTEVYKVRDIIGNRILAMKVLREDAPKEAELSMNREFYYLSRFAHAGIVAALDFGSTPEHRPFFTMEFCDGVPITTYFSKGYAPELIEVTVQLLSALDSIHAQGLIHSDLKPQNIIVSDDGGNPKARLLDFGFAEKMSLSDASIPRGTLGYVAPEVFKGNDADARADLYSLGMVLYETITSHGPSQEKDIRTWLKKQYYSELDPPRKFDPDIPEKFDALVMALIRREPERRPRSAAAVMEELAGPGARETTTVTGPRKYLMAPGFVGRAEHLVRLKELLANAAQKKPGIACVSGERGVGKTRLLSEFKFAAQLEGATILSVEPVSLGARPQSLVESVLNYLRVYSGATLPACDEGSVAVSEESKFRLFDTATQRLMELSASHRVEHSLVLLVDDFEVFDPTSLEFLRYLAFSLSTERLMVLVAGLKEKRFLDLIAELEQRPYCTHIPLPPMEPLEAEALLQSLLGDIPQMPTLVEWVMGTTGGNPLFIIETVYSLIDAKLLLLRGTRWAVQEDALRAYRPPYSVTEVVKRRLDNLSDEELEILQIGAAAAGPFQLEFLRAVLGYDDKILFNAVARLKSLGLLKTFSQDNEAAFILASKILEATVTERLPVEKRRDNHRRVALALELLYPDKHDRLLFDLAHHYTQAGMADRAYDYSVKAGARARDYQLVEQALAFYETALALSAQIATPKQRIEIIEIVGRLREATGKYLEAIDIYTQGMGIIVADPDLAKEKQLLARYLHKLGLVHQKQGHNEEALNYFSQALLMQHDKGTPAYIHILTDLGWSYTSAHNFDKAEQLLTQALQQIEKLRHSDPAQYNALTARTLYYFSVLAWSRYDYVLALQLAERSLGVYETIRDDYNTAKTSQFIATLWWRRGELDKARDYYQRYLPHHRKTGDVYYLLRALQGLGLISQDEGEWDKAYDYFLEAQALAERIHDIAALADLHCNIAMAADERGEWQTAEDHLHRAITLYDAHEKTNTYGRPGAIASLGNLKTREGDLEQALQYLTQASQFIAATQDPDLTYHHLVYQVAYALAAEKHDQAVQCLVRAWKLAKPGRDWRKLAQLETLAAQLRLQHQDGQRASDHAVRALERLKDYPSSKEYAVALRYAGLSQAQLDHPEKAAMHLKRSIQLLRDMGSKYELALSLLASVQALTKQNQSDLTVDLRMPVTVRPVPQAQLDEALANLKEAQALLSVLGARLDSQKAEDLMQTLTQISATMQLKTRERGEYLKAYYHLSELIAMDLDKDDFAERVLDLIIELTKAERGLLFLTQGDKLVPAAARNVDHATLQDAETISHTVLRKVKRRGELVFSSDAVSDPRFNAANSVMLNKIRSLLCVPLRVDNRVIGTIYLDSRITAHLFLEEDKNLLISVANLLAATIDKSVAFRRLQDEMHTMRDDILVDAVTGAFLGRSKTIREVYKVIDKIAPTDCTVLLTGETGTGKGVYARLVHSKSERRGKKFVSVNCGTLPENLFESELFGHAKGAFTGAVRDKEGIFETAEGGTIFLDEISNTTPGIQAKLLQVLEERIIRRVGETQTRQVDVRLICATNRNLEDDLRSGKFREDLYYRMNVVSIHVPALRDRAADIPLLSNFFLKRYTNQLNKPVTGFEESVMALFGNYPWRGNVRELQNVIERAVIMTQKRRISVEDLGGRFTEIESAPEVAPNRRRIFDRDQVLKALKETNGNVSKAAELLPTHRRQLQRLIRRYRIDRTSLN
jgi:Nif-specific regulatory protein